MLDAKSEIMNLRQRLKLKNLSDSAIDEICDEVSRDISVASADAIADAMIEAVNVGANLKSTDMIEELKAVRTGPSFEIITDSGRTDFSEPPFPMLPRLLKNAKVAQDGSQYKVIPLKQKTTNNRLSVTTEAAIANINNARRLAKELRDANKDTNSGAISPDAMMGMDTFAAMQAINRSRQKQQKQGQVAGAVIDFKTASSKQDANTKWVMPAKNRDATAALRDINMNLDDSIDRIISDTINRYEGMF